MMNAMPVPGEAFTGNSFVPFKFATYADVVAGEDAGLASTSADVRARIIE
jgi:hypothetical protein